MALDKEIQKILNRAPNIQDIPHAFYSKEADLNKNGQETSTITDEFGKSVAVNFIGGCSVGADGKVIPATDEEELAAEPDTYEYLGYIDDVGVFVRTDHTPERPMQTVSIDPFL